MSRRGWRALWPARRIAGLGVALLLVVVSLSCSAAMVGPLRYPPTQFNMGAWELRHFPNKWLYAFGRLFHEDPSVAQENATLQRFFQLTYEIDTLEAAQIDAPDDARAADIAGKREQRLELQRESERILQGRIQRVLKDQGITRSLLVRRIVWPPVTFEFADAPRMMAISPRERIFLKKQYILRDNLSLADIETLETQTEKRDNVAARAFPLGGFGAYPTLVDYGDDYLATLQVVAHEWTHNYLFFRPLGFNYSKNNDLTTMNETTADLVGHEVAAEVARRWPLDASRPPPPAPPTPAAPRVDVTAELRKLRGEVDALLAQGKVDEAEALMEQRRQELAARGVRIRKINQAYFAFLNLYAGSAGNGIAVNRIGPKIDELRRKTASLRGFVNVVGDLTSVDALDRALSR